MNISLIPNYNAESQLHWSYLLLEKHYHQFTNCHNNVTCYVLNSCLIFFIFFLSFLTNKIDQQQRNCICLEDPPFVLFFRSLKALAFERLLYFVFMLRVFLTGSQCSDCSFSYYGEAFPQKSLCSIFWTLNLTNFLLTCSSEVHFVPVFFRLKILLAQAYFLLGFAICSVLMEKRKRWGLGQKRNISWKAAYEKGNECSCSLIVGFCWKRAIAWLSWKWVYWRFLVHSDACMLVPPLEDRVSLHKVLDFWGFLFMLCSR